MAGDDVKAKAPSMPRIDSIDGCRFAWVLPIVIAHFAHFSTRKERLPRSMTLQHVIVGGFFFFVISGYVAGYAFTKLGEKAAVERELARPVLLFWLKVMAYHPLHFAIVSLFTPLHVLVERMYNTPWHMTAFRGLLSFSMRQAWFPTEGAIWNQPSWFLSALTFSNLTRPAILTRVAELGKGCLRRPYFALDAVTAVQKVPYAEAARFHAHNLTSRQQYPHHLEFQGVDRDDDGHRDRAQDVVLRFHPVVLEHLLLDVRL